MLALLQDVRDERLELLVRYAPCLKEVYPQELLQLFTTKICEYGAQNVGRAHYKYIAGAPEESPPFPLWCNRRLQTCRRFPSSLPLPSSYDAGVESV